MLPVFEALDDQNCSSDKGNKRVPIDSFKMNDAHAPSDHTKPGQLKQNDKDQRIQKKKYNCCCFSKIYSASSVWLQTDPAQFSNRVWATTESRLKLKSTENILHWKP